MSEDSARSAGYSIYSDNKQFNITWGDGITSHTNTKASIGDYTALLVLEIPENLVGIAPLVDNGYSIEFDSRRAIIRNSRNHNAISVPRSSDGFWRVNLQVLGELQKEEQDMFEYDPEEDNNIKALSARLYEIPLSIRERVIELHLRMGHASCDSMCQAVSGDFPIWKDTKLRPIDDSFNVFA